MSLEPARRNADAMKVDALGLVALGRALRAG